MLAIKIKSYTIKGIYLSLLMTNQVHSVVMGTFDHKNETAYISDRHNSNGQTSYQLLFVNFKEQTVTKIDSGRTIDEVALSPSGKYLAYERANVSSSDKRRLIIKRISDGKVIRDVSTNSSFIRWNKSGDALSYMDYNIGKIFEYNLSTNELISIEYGKLSYPYIVKWSTQCSCFLYHLSKVNEQNSPYELKQSKVYRINNNVLEVYPELSTLTSSDNKKYYFNIHSEPENGTYINFYNNKTKEKIIGGIGVRFLNPGEDILWFDDVFRYFGSTLWIDLKSQEIKRSEIIEHLEFNLNYNYDVAADKKGFILRYNKKVFEVEDVRTGNIIKSYKKFW